MKFTVKSVLGKSPRIGEISHIIGKPNISLETPLVLLHTQAGHIPHITHQVLGLITQRPLILQIPLVSIHTYEEALEFYKGRISDFIGNKDSLTCVTLHDPSSLTKEGYHIKDNIPIFTRNGKVLYNSEKYMNMIENCKPDMYVLMSDGDTNVASPNKRITKAVENTVHFVEQCIERHKKSDVLKETFVIAPIAGGYCLKHRQSCIDLLMKNNSHFDGYLIDGLHNNGPEVEFISFGEVKPIVECVTQKLPFEKLRLVQGCWSPLNIINFVKCGIDLFDSSYCKILTERSAVLVFGITANDSTEAYEINLRKNKFADDFQPLLRNCKCVTCLNYSRAYIHHLLTVQELLGSVLIMVHNIHHMLRFFEEIRESLKNDTLDKLEERVADQFNLLEIQDNNDLESELSSTILE